MSFSEPVDVGAWRIYGGDYRAIEATIHSGDANRLIVEAKPITMD